MELYGSGDRYVRGLCVTMRGTCVLCHHRAMACHCDGAVARAVLQRAAGRTSDH